MTRTELKFREELKRERCSDPKRRWRAIQTMIAWADEQAPVPRNSPAGCLAEQRRLLRSRARLAARVKQTRPQTG